MTTKPKARKFRIKRATPAAAPKGTDAVERDAPAAAPPKPQAPDAPRAAAASRGEAPKAAAPSQAAAASAARPTPPSDARSGEVSSATEVSGEQDIDAIRREGLTGRQLRMARRVAQKHGLAPTSDFDAVRLLRAEGIDPFQRSNMLELVVPQDKQSTGTALQKGIRSFS